MTKLHRRAVAGALVAVLAFAGAACSDDDDDTAETGSAPEETTTTAGDDGGDAEVIEIIATEYQFDGVPEDPIASGTVLSLTNEGDEPHELIAVLIPEDETRSVDEIAALSEEEQSAVFGEEPEPAAVILAATGTTDTPGAVVGDGSLTEPGRYALLCFLPVGATDEILTSDGPPTSDAPPHVAEGMFAEITVE